MKSWRRLWAVVLKELRQIRRDRISMVMIVAIPVIDLLLFGYAINFNPRNLDAMIVDQANTAASRAAVMDMRATGIIEITGVGDSPAQAMEQLRRGRLSVAIVLPPDYDRRLAEGGPAVQVMVDGTDTVVQAAAVQLAQLPLEAVNGRRAWFVVVGVGYLIGGSGGMVIALIIAALTQLGWLKDRYFSEVSAVPLPLAPTRAGRGLAIVAIAAWCGICSPHFLPTSAAKFGYSTTRAFPPTP